MKNIILIAALAALGGCAVAPSNQGYYGGAGAGYARNGYPQSGDPSQWRVVSVTPVPRGTAERVYSQNGNGSTVQYSSEPVYGSQPVYVQQPVYVPQPLYVPEPAYVYPPVSLSLGFMFGRSWGWGGGHGHRRHR